MTNSSAEERDPAARELLPSELQAQPAAEANVLNDGPAQPQVMLPPQPAQPPPAPLYPDVMAEIEKIQNKKKSWSQFIVVLAFSIFLFMAAEYLQGTTKLPKRDILHSLYLIIPILFFHEFGHFAAMKVFGYKNVQMFFIPLFGAAVSGRSYGVAGWKKVIVSLMGPLPGIFLGFALGIPGLMYNNAATMEAASLLLLINSFNLLPILPLDGGRALQTLYFCRHPAIDFGFRLVAALCFVAMVVALGGTTLIVIAMFSLISLPVVWRIGKLAAELRKDPALAAVADSPTLDRPLLEAIISRMKQDAVFARWKSNVIASHTLSVYETVASRPPGWMATIGLTVVYASTICMGFLMSVLLIAARQGGGLQGVLSAARDRPRIAVTLNNVRVAGGGSGANSGELSALPVSIVANFKTLSEAQQAFDALKGTLAPGESLEQFAQTLFFSVPAKDTNARKRRVAELDKLTKDVCVSGLQSAVVFRFNAFAPSQEVAEQTQEELESYRVPWGYYLTAPWDPSVHETSEAAAQHRVARHTYRLLEKTNSDIWRDPRVKALDTRTRDAFRLGDQDELKRIQDDRRKLMEEIRTAALKSLKNTTDGSIDQVVVQKYIDASTKWNEYSGEDLESVLEPPADTDIAPLLGQLPLSGSRPTPDAMRYSWHYGAAEQNGIIISVTGTFIHPPDGARALLTWFENRKFRHMTYAFQSTPLTEEDQ